MEETNIPNAIDTKQMTDEELQNAVEKTIERVRNDGILIGYRTAATVLMQTIAPWRQSNCSKREYERIFKKLEEFFGKALQKNNEELFGNNTELMEDHE